MVTKIQFFIAALASAQEKFSTKSASKLLINRILEVMPISGLRFAICNVGLPHCDSPTTQCGSPTLRQPYSAAPYTIISPRKPIPKN